MENIRGIVLMVASMAGFALEDMFVKSMADGLPVSQILILLGFAGALIFGTWAKLRGERLLPPEIRHPLMILRNVGEMIGTVMFVNAIVLIPLATASAILQATPLAVALGAALFMGAEVGWRRWLAILVGFAGVLMVVRPGLAGFEPASLLAVGAVFCLAARDLATRAAPAHLSSPVLSCWGFAAAGVAGLVLVPVSGAPHWPTPDHWLMLGGALGCGVAAYYAITLAMRVGDVAVVTPFRYARLIFAVIIGMLVFGERPDLWTLIGSAVIIGSGLYTLMREQMRRRAAQRALAAMTS
ncbi:DMT family transporter [Fluviibacterium sp. DFM31]|uniref:DMT family transporter n=1 Tax=Meridianimarinicoccus marinus TaxID=3231483 RepID=A0ABV3L1C9_9RHOB